MRSHRCAVCTLHVVSSLQQQQQFSSSSCAITDLPPHLFVVLKQDPVASIKHYEERYGMKLVDVYHTPTLGTSNYYLASLRDGEGETWPVPGTAEVSKRQRCGR